MNPNSEDGRGQKGCTGNLPRGMLRLADKINRSNEMAASFLRQLANFPGNDSALGGGIFDIPNAHDF